jgi:2-polyprenyl-3-methyl-5-hydroxy-6-metoxy-1,4-benzoquinol methylase
MVKDPRTDPRLETSQETQELKKLRGKQHAISEYWDERFENVYCKVLENASEMGRHGVIAEIINRTVLKGNILDVGCGTGILSALVDLKRFQYLGIDISEVALRSAKEKRKKPNVTFQRASIESFDPQHQFDVIVFNEVLYYLDYKNVVKQIAGWVNRSKLIIASIFDFDEGYKLRKWLQNNTNIISEIIIENPKDNLKWYVNALKLS